MVVRIRFGHGPTVQQRQRKNKHVALALASLLTPAVVMAGVLAAWRLTADLKATSQFPISSGFFSHWQVWLGSASILQLVVIGLNRYGNSQPVIRKPVEHPEQKLVS